MVKQRMATADIAAEIACLKQRGIVGMRCTNVYDISSRMYVLKLARSGEDGEKVLLLIESGARLHTVDTMPEKSHVPSNFSLKLRKHIRSRRLEDICQLGVDRIVQLTFGSADTTVHLLLEFYAQGNVILADGKYEVLTLLRSHRDDAKGMATMARHTYPIHTVRLREPVPAEALRAAVDPSFVGDAVGAVGEGGEGGALKGKGNTTLDSEVTFSSLESRESEQDGGGEEGEGGDVEKVGGASAAAALSTSSASASKAADVSLKTALDVVVPYGRLVAEHCILTAGLDPARQPSVSPLSEAEHAALLSAVRSFEKWLDGCEGAAPGGAILLSQKKGGKEGKEGSNNPEEGDKSDTAAATAAETAAVYEEFHPLLAGGLPFAQHTGLPMLTFPTFDAAVAEFFGKIQGQRTASQQATREKAAMGKLEAIRRDHESRLSTLGKDVVEAEHKAALIELNLDAVDAALNAVREALAGGIDWADLSRMIKDEKKAGNPVAALIDSLQLEKSKITLLLRDSLYDEEEGEEEEEEEEDGCIEKEEKGQQSKSARHRPTVSKVEVDLELTAHANARAYYDARRKHTDKTRRTLEANERALAAAEKKAREQLERVRGAAAGAGAAAAAAAVRKPYWFERFHWFISSENYLVLSGRDAQQNELLVKRYLRRGDVYVHADLHGASSTIIKNPDPATPIPPLTLSEAGQACVCRSAAWDAKVVTSAWWVHPDQVSKTAPTGEYLTTGSFMIRGRKNYLPPQPLVMGLAWLFRLEEGSVSAHLGERVPRWMGAGSGSGVAGVGAGSIVGEGDELDVEAEASSDAQTPAGADGGGGSNEGGEGGQSALDAFMDSSVDAMASSVTATYNRYGLAEGVSAAAGGRGAEEEQQLEGAAQAQAQGDRPATRHLSAKERQLMKKGILPATGPLPPPQPKQKKEEGAPEGAGGGGGRPPAAAPSAAADQQGGSKAARGKKTRRKAKYDDQDEEDRELAMALLQSAGQRKDRKQRKDDRKAKLAAKKAAKSSVPSQNVTAEDIAKLTARLDLPSDDEKSGADEGEEGEEEHGSQLSDSGSAASSDGEGGDAGGGGATKKEVVGEPKIPGSNKEEEDSEAEAARKERAEVAEMLAEENVGLLDEADKERLTQLDELTGCPRVEDVLLYAVPMCAPYQVVAGYKYRVKLVPGTQKKGKAYRQAVELLAGLRTTGGSGGGGAAAEAGALRERELVRAVPEPDGINAMVGGVKLQVAGLQKMQQAKKKAGKKK